MDNEQPVIGSRQPATTPPLRRRRFGRLVLKALGLLLLLAAMGVLFWLREALYDHFIGFPRQEAAWKAIRAQRRAVGDDAGWNEYRGILHSHSKLSHDSEVPFEEILRAMKADGLDFICLSDHCVAGRADFNAQWRGMHEGKLFVAGFEMKDGIMPFGVAPGVVLSNATDGAALARQIVENGGVLFYAHPEEPRAWDRPELTGMEIYNIHSDLKALRHPVGTLLPQLIINQRSYPDHVFRLLFRRPTPFLQRWDDMNRTRHLTGIAANDCHQNSGFRGFVTATNTLWIEDTSPRKLREVALNWFTRPLARLCFGPLTPGRKLFDVQLDPYERMARFVNTHVLARELSESALLESLRAGRAYIGFDMVADSSGFRWFARNPTGRAVMGEQLPLSPETRLEALSPLPCRLTVLRDGAPVWRHEGRGLEWAPPGPGKYRVEAELRLAGQWVPWVYANPIELR